MAEMGPVELVGGRDSWFIWPLVWEGGSVCMKGGVGLKSIPRSKDEMGESLGNECGVGGGMSDPGHGCGVGRGMLRLRDGCGVDGEGSGLGTTRRVATH